MRPAHLAALLLLAACTQTDADACIAENPAGPEFDVENRWHPGEVPPLLCPDDGTDEPCGTWPEGVPEPSTPVEELLAECAADGQECDAHEWMSEKAAACVARSHGLAEGMHGLTAELVYNYEYRRVIWVVTNVVSEDPGDGKQGDLMALDAVSGDLLDRGSWSMVH